MKNKFLKLCHKLSSYSDHHQHKMAAVVVRKNKVVSVGWNSLKTHPKSPHAHKTQHAEFSAIKQLSPEQLEGATIFVYRAHADGSLANARPCQSCLRLIIEVGIRKIIYTHEENLQIIMC